MASISYAQCAATVPAALTQAHQQFWDSLRSAGSWWTAAERIAIAVQVREASRCALCRDRKAALVPSALTGSHTADTALPDDAVEIIHRVVTDPGRLSRSWFERVTAGAVSVEQYVELLGVLVGVLSIDSFCAGIGVAPHPLPAPDRAAGAPSRYRPPSAVLEDAWVPMIPAAGNAGAEADLWPSGRTANVIRAMSLVPDAVRALAYLGAAHYLPHHKITDAGARGEHLDRQQMELLAGRVSALNQCFY